jgi:hypothetical protein
MSHNAQTQTTVPDPIELLYGPCPGAVTMTVPEVHQAPRQPRKTREEKGRELFEKGAVQLPNRPIADLLNAMRFHGLRVQVESESSPGAYYSVNGVCSCADYLRHAEENSKHLCKHRIALKLAVEDRIEAERQAERQAEEDVLSAEEWAELARRAGEPIIPVPYHVHHSSTLTDEDWVALECAHSHGSAIRNSAGGWDIIPVTDY